MNASAPVLIGFDGSDDAKVAIARAATLFGDREAIVLSVWQRAYAAPNFVMPGFTYRGDMSAFNATAERIAIALAGEGAELATEAGLRAQPRHACASGPIAEAILNVAGEDQVAAIVLGSRGRGGVRSALLGSVSNHVIHHSSRPTLVVRHDAPGIAAEALLVLCYDGSADAQHAIDQAGALFAPRRALVVTAWQSAQAVPAFGLEGVAYLPDFETIDRDAEDAARQTAEAGCERARAAGLTAEPRAVCATGSLWPALATAADRHDAATVVLGSRGLSCAQVLFLGSVSSSVMHHTKRPVLVVRRDARSEHPAAPPADGASLSTTTP